MKKENYKLIYIEWDDPSSSKSLWVDKEEAEEFGKKIETIVKTSGWLIKETKDYIVLVDYWSPADDTTNDLFNYLHKILKKNIIRRKILKV